MHPAYVTEEVQFPLDNSLDDIDAYARSFRDRISFRKPRVDSCPFSYQYIKEFNQKVYLKLRQVVTTDM